MKTLMRSGRVEATTTATPEQVWAVVADVTRVGEWSHECKVGEWLDGATAAAPGVRYRGSNKVGRVRWARTNEIVAVDEGSRLVWRTVATKFYRDSTEWQIKIELCDGGSRIIQTFEVLELGPIMDRLFYLLTPPHRDRLPALKEDLQRLGEVAATSSTTGSITSSVTAG
jgi:hypothetical protein